MAQSKLPTRLKLLAWGDNPSTKGNIRLNHSSAATLPERQRLLGFDRIALDFEHNTVPGTDEFNRTQEPRPVAAYGVPRIISGEGLFLESIQWTPAGESSAANYADLSPAVNLDENGAVDFIHSAALVRQGAVYGLTFTALTAGLPRLTILAAIPMFEKPRGFARALAAHRADVAKLAALSAKPPGKAPAGLRGVARSIAAHRAENSKP